MPALNTAFDYSPERDSPFFVEYERLRSQCRNGDIVSHVCRISFDERLNQTKKRVKGLAQCYFPEAEDMNDIGPRSKCLAIGMIIGLCAGYMSVPRLARAHFLDQVVSRLDFESTEFGGYHVDTSSLADQVDPQFCALNLAGSLPLQKQPFLNGIMAVGVGWMAQQVHDYHAEVLSTLTPYALWKSRNYRRDCIKSDLGRLSGMNEITIADLQNTR